MIAQIAKKKNYNLLLLSLVTSLLLAQQQNVTSTISPNLEETNIHYDNYCQ
jgi:hypothetical protein